MLSCYSRNAKLPPIMRNLPIYSATSAGSAESAESAEPARDFFSDLTAAVSERRARLLVHPLYQKIRTLSSLQTFMRNHVFAVWDFMTLLKSLQRRLTCVDIPWLPPADTVAARLINEIVLSEESDEVVPGRYVGHLHLYLAAMGEVDADTRPIRDLIAALRHEAAVEDVLPRLPILPATRRFVLRNLAMARAETHETAAAFLFGREDLVPDMFQRIVSDLELSGTRCEAFRCYLERHILLDGGEHRMLGAQLLRGMCGNDGRKWRASTAAACEALDERTRLWDGIFAVIEAHGPACEDPLPVM